MHNVKKNTAAGAVVGEMREVLKKVAEEQVQLAQQVQLGGAPEVPYSFPALTHSYGLETPQTQHLAQTQA